MHEIREISRGRADHEVPVIWHDAVGEQGDGYPFKGLNEHPLEGLVIPSFEKELVATNRSIVDVNHQVVRRSQ
jgi:hypothetical protein